MSLLFQRSTKTEWTTIPPSGAFLPPVEDDSTALNKTEEKEDLVVVVKEPQKEDGGEGIAVEYLVEDSDTHCDKEETTRNDEEKETTTDEEVPDRFQQGDHVYQWCSFAGIPCVFSHHGIVMHVEDLADDEQLLTIVDFSNLLLRDKDPSLQASSIENATTVLEEEESPQQMDGVEVIPTQHQSASAFVRSGSALDRNSPVVQKGGMRCYKTTSKESRWRKVIYQEGWFNTHIWKRSGTCTPVKSDPPEVVLKRVHFLLSHSHIYNPPSHKDDKNASSPLLPNFHPVFANCECVAVYCKTGSWCTLQASSFLSHAAVGQVKATATISGIAAAQTATVPAAGVWGWLGYTTTVPLMSVHPLILPGLCAYGAITVGVPAITLTIAKQKWKDITKRLNDALEAESLQLALVT